LLPQFNLPTDTLVQVLGIAWQQGRGVSDSYFQIAIEQQCQVEVELARRQRVLLRWNNMPTDQGVAVTMRMQRLGDSAKVKSFEQGGYLSWHIKRFKAVQTGEGGLTAFAGTVGSGKSTALAQLMMAMPPNRKAVSFEDPVEIELPNVLQKSIARDMLSAGDRDPAFEAAVRSLFRSALDAFLLSEIRDRATGRVARAVLESGHTVLTTVHAGSAALIFDRLSSPEIDIPLGVLASPGNVRLAVFQALVPAACPRCAKSPDDFAHAKELRGPALEQHHRYFDLLERLYGIDPGKYRLFDPGGCSHCRAGREELPQFWGTVGRTVVCEMMEPGGDDEMLRLMLAGDKVGVRQHWRSLASKSFEDDDLTGKTALECGILKASKGQIDPRHLEAKFGSFEAFDAQQQRLQDAKKLRLV